MSIPFKGLVEHNQLGIARRHRCEFKFCCHAGRERRYFHVHLKPHRLDLFLHML